MEHPGRNAIRCPTGSRSGDCRPPVTTVARISERETTIVREPLDALVHSFEPVPDPPVRRSGSARSRDSTAPSADPAVHGGSEVLERDGPAGQETVADPLGPRAQPRGGRSENMKHVPDHRSSRAHRDRLARAVRGPVQAAADRCRDAAGPRRGRGVLRGGSPAISERSRGSWRVWTRWCTSVASRARTRGKQSGTSTSTARTTCSNPLAVPGSSGWSMPAACTRWASIRATGR